MIWNYRIVRYRNKSGFGLHEVMYDDKGKPFGMTKSAIKFYSGAEEGPKQVEKDMRLALRDIKRMPVLREPKKWPGKVPGDERAR